MKRVTVAIALVTISTSNVSLSAQAGKVTSFGPAVRIVNSVDKMTDRDMSFLVVHGTDNPLARQIMWMCAPDKTEHVVYIWGKFLVPSQKRIKVEYRFDTHPAVGVYFDSAPNNKSGSFSDLGQPTAEEKAFVSGAETASTVLMRVTDANDGEMVTDTFNLTGLAEARAVLACATRK